MKNLYILRFFIIFICFCFTDSYKYNTVLNNTSLQIKAFKNKFFTGLTPRIIGGYKAKDNQFPWQVILITNLFEKSVCGGSIISENWVLTAASCVDGYDTLFIGVGTINLNKIDRIIKSKYIVKHPNFKSNKSNYDIALINLSKNINFNEKVNKIQLVSRSQAGNSFTGQIIYVSGFGYTSDEILDYSNDLLYTIMEIITNKDCRDIYGSDVILDSTICAKSIGINEFHNKCVGDGGGAAIIEQNGNYMQIGIDSFHFKSGCEKRAPAGFTRVGSFLDFISINTGMILN